MAKKKKPSYTRVAKENRALRNIVSSLETYVACCLKFAYRENYAKMITGEIGGEEFRGVTLFNNDLHKWLSAAEMDKRSAERVVDSMRLGSFKHSKELHGVGLKGFYGWAAEDMKRAQDSYEEVFGRRMYLDFNDRLYVGLHDYKRELKKQDKHAQD